MKSIPINEGLGADCINSFVLFISALLTQFLTEKNFKNLKIFKNLSCSMR